MSAAGTSSCSSPPVTLENILEALGCVYAPPFFKASHGVSPGPLGLEGDPVNSIPLLSKLNTRERLAGVKQLEI